MEPTVLKDRVAARHFVVFWPPPIKYLQVSVGHPTPKFRLLVEARRKELVKARHLLPVRLLLGTTPAHSYGGKLSTVAIIVQVRAYHAWGI